MSIRPETLLASDIRLKTNGAATSRRFGYGMRRMKSMAGFGLGPAPIKTDRGWLQLAHGVRDTAAGLLYVLYLFLCDLHEPWRVTHQPGGYFIAPEGEERIGDVSNVVFSSGWVARTNGEVFIYDGHRTRACT